MKNCTILPFQPREGRRRESEPGFRATLLQLLNREMKLSACTPAGFNYSLNQRNIKSNISFDIKYNDELHESSFCACIPQEGERHLPSRKARERPGSMANVKHNHGVIYLHCWAQSRGTVLSCEDSLPFSRIVTRTSYYSANAKCISLPVPPPLENIKMGNLTHPHVIYVLSLSFGRRLNRFHLAYCKFLINISAMRKPVQNFVTNFR